MKKAAALIAMAWYFLIFSPNANSVSIAGPFDHRETCIYFRGWALLLSEDADLLNSDPPAPGTGKLGRFGTCYEVAAR